MSLRPEVLERLRTALAIELQTCVAQLGPLPFEQEGTEIKKIIGENDDIAFLALGMGLEVCRTKNSWEPIQKCISGIRKSQKSGYVSHYD